MEEQDKLVESLREVDVVISALAYPQVLDQLKILEAIKIAGNIKVYKVFFFIKNCLGFLCFFFFQFSHSITRFVYTKLAHLIIHYWTKHI